jgi:membrane protein DedA with SNARE-associated domain
MKSIIIKICERGLAIIAYIFPFVEISSTLALKVFLTADSQFLRFFYFTYISPVTDFYRTNIYLCFAIMLGTFIVCAKGKVPFTNGKRKVPLTLYLRVNIIQAILINVVSTCIGVLYSDIPLAIQESSIGLSIATGLYFWVLMLITSSIIVIIFGRYPKIPVISEAARLQVQRHD